MAFWGHSNVILVKGGFKGFAGPQLYLCLVYLQCSKQPWADQFAVAMNDTTKARCAEALDVVDRETNGRTETRDGDRRDRDRKRDRSDRDPGERDRRDDVHR